jgi:hypothetical protein
MSDGSTVTHREEPDMSITLTATNPTAQILRRAVLGVLELADLTTAREVIVTVADAPYFRGCWCEEGKCGNVAVASAIYTDLEDGVTEQALCAGCVASAVEWLRLSDQVDHTEDIDIYVDPTWLRDTHRIQP